MGSSELLNNDLHQKKGEKLSKEQKIQKLTVQNANKVKEKQNSQETEVKFTKRSIDDLDPYSRAMNQISQNNFRNKVRKVYKDRNQVDVASKTVDDMVKKLSIYPEKFIEQRDALILEIKNNLENNEREYKQLNEKLHKLGQQPMSKVKKLLDWIDVKKNEKKIFNEDLKLLNELSLLLTKLEAAKYYSKVVASEVNSGSNSASSSDYSSKKSTNNQQPTTYYKYYQSAYSPQQYQNFDTASYSGQYYGGYYYPYMYNNNYENRAYVPSNQNMDNSYSNFYNYADLYNYAVDPSKTGYYSQTPNSYYSYYPYDSAASRMYSSSAQQPYSNTAESVSYPESRSNSASSSESSLNSSKHIFDSRQPSNTKEVFNSEHGSVSKLPDSRNVKTLKKQPQLSLEETAKAVNALNFIQQKVGLDTESMLRLITNLKELANIDMKNKRRALQKELLNSKRSEIAGNPLNTDMISKVGSMQKNFEDARDRFWLIKEIEWIVTRIEAAKYAALIKFEK